MTLPRVSVSTGDGFDWKDEFWTEDESSDLFTIGQCYEKNAAITLVCVKCGGDEFHVGQGSYYTAIMCTKCQWEKCIHDG